MKIEFKFKVDQNVTVKSESAILPPMRVLRRCYEEGWTGISVQYKCLKNNDDPVWFDESELVSVIQEDR